ncbi:unnamed protein product [Boreogadus saida]
MESSQPKTAPGVGGGHHESTTDDLLVASAECPSDDEDIDPCEPSSVIKALNFNCLAHGSSIQLFLFDCVWQTLWRTLFIHNPGPEHYYPNTLALPVASLTTLSASAGICVAAAVVDRLTRVG